MSFNIEISKEALINANTLRDSNVQKRAIKENIVEIIRKLNEDLITAHREGKHHIIAEIPIVFDVPHMSNTNAQRAIWSNIIEILKEKNYRVIININNKCCRLKITWMSQDDEKNITHQTQVIAEHSKQF